MEFVFFDLFFGEFSLEQLDKFHRNTQIAYFLLVDDNLALGIALYPSAVFVCDPLGKLSLQIPEKLSNFFFDHCLSNIFITTKICDYCFPTIHLFFSILSETHCYKTFVSHFSDNYSLNELIVRTCLERRGIVVGDKDES